MTLLKRLRHTFLRRQKGYSKKRPLLAEFLEARSMLSASFQSISTLWTTPGQSHLLKAVQVLQMG